MAKKAMVRACLSRVKMPPLYGGNENILPGYHTRCYMAKAAFVACNMP